MLVWNLLTCLILPCLMALAKTLSLLTRFLNLHHPSRASRSFCYTGDWVISSNYRKGFKSNLPSHPFHLNIIFTTLQVSICGFQWTLISNDSSKFKELLIHSQIIVLGKKLVVGDQLFNFSITNV